MDNRLEKNHVIAEWLLKFASYHPKTMDFDLSRTYRLLNDLGNPHLNIPPVFHAAGTNGKGSTLAFLKAILNKLGHKTHVMTSPHLMEFRERFVISDQMVSNQILSDYMAIIDHKNAQQPATFFELITAVGFQLFADIKADFTLLETGMGGRLDSTNIIPAPLITIITMISMDHQQFLGSSIAEIAGEKAGIMKENVPCVIGVQTKYAIDNGVFDVFQKRAADLNVPLYRHGFEWDYQITNTGFDLMFDGKIIHCPTPNLLGIHQYANAATAMMAYIIANNIKPIGEIEIAKQGIKYAVWRGRLEALNTGALKNYIGTHDQVWLDGGHNDSAGEALAKQIIAWKNDDGLDTHLITGMLNTKTPTDFINPMQGLVKSITTITIPDQPLSFKADALAAIVGAQAADNLTKALQHIHATYPAQKRVLIAGSLYLAGHVLMMDTL